ncbi:hypothetical protein WN55_07965 [Dufourea novaeangliae]|uniref:Uncharacterized protein n=1 Tax=Dufourea novaeangliae TaxID=178035 RepID=A0A154PSM2_DUFNO|nr:hypothetical protein WN55_07965 [Dufourea novaeangliae]
MDYQQPSSSGLADKKRSNKGKVFQLSWLKNNIFKDWLKSDNNKKAFCTACNKVLACGKSELIRHSRTQLHIKNTSKSCDITPSVLLPKVDSNSDLDHVNKVKTAEIKLAAFYAEHNIAFQTINHMVPLLQETCSDPQVHSLAGAEGIPSHPDGGDEHPKSSHPGNRGKYFPATTAAAPRVPDHCGTHEGPGVADRVGAGDTSVPSAAANFGEVGGPGLVKSTHTTSKWCALGPLVAPAAKGANGVCGWRDGGVYIPMTDTKNREGVTAPGVLGAPGAGVGVMVERATPTSLSDVREGRLGNSVPQEPAQVWWSSRPHLCRHLTTVEPARWTTRPAELQELLVKEGIRIPPQRRCPTPRGGLAS